VNSHADKPFRDRLLALPQSVQEDARKAFQQFQQDARHPALQFKKVTGKDGKEYWSARIGLHYRALARMGKDGVHWFWIGTHGEYDKLVA
jgi:mRNA-degrading endonuclease RelE of RelBE toxin-antitoxin system